MPNPSRGTSLFPLLLALWLGAGFPSLAAQSWNEDSYQDFADGRLEAKAETPAHSRLRFRVRSGAEPSGLEQKPWRQVNGDRFPLESGDRVLQYQAGFESGNGDSYPILDRVSVELNSD